MTRGAERGKSRHASILTMETETPAEGGRGTPLHRGSDSPLGPERGGQPQPVPA